jgi:predicted phage replisome organizer
MAQDVQWIKFKVGTFDGNSFKRIKRAKIEGIMNFRDKLTAVWFELLDLGGKVNNDGFLINDEIAFISFEDIAIALDREEKEIEMCINWFTQNNMMEIINDIYLISNWTKYQNNDGLEKIREQNRLRQQNYRERNKQLALENNDNVSVTLRNANTLISKSKSFSNSSIITKPKEDNNILDYFDTFWKAYPKKMSKGQAEKTFKKLKVDSELLEKMLSAIELQKDTKNWREEKGKYIPYPSTWLNAKGWENEVQVKDRKKIVDDYMLDNYKKTGELM